ncbi:histone chaperone RTT106-like isoform X2 [Orbicella faveolata]|nr:histone chaperone RTT106-like isoform X2 [Orbicella faveolata]
MDEDSSDQQASAEVTPASSENDLLANKSEDSVDDDDDEDDDDIDKMLNELQSFQEELEQKSQQSTEDEQSPGVLSFVPPSQPLDQFRFSISAIEGRFQKY